MYLCLPGTCHVGQAYLLHMLVSAGVKSMCHPPCLIEPYCMKTLLCHHEVFLSHNIVNCA